MNGIPRARRASRPIRVSLATDRSGVIDGAWWPHSSAIAAELPDLIGALHPALGEVEALRPNAGGPIQTTVCNLRLPDTLVAPAGGWADAEVRRPRNARALALSAIDACVRAGMCSVRGCTWSMSATRTPYMHDGIHRPGHALKTLASL